MCAIARFIRQTTDALFFFLLQAILEILLRGEQLGEDVHLDQIAKDTDGFSGSDLKRMFIF